MGLLERQPWTRIWYRRLLWGAKIQGMSKLTAQRLGLFKLPIGVAVLRNLNVQVSENWTEEPLTELNLRVLYRLRFLSEQRPLDLTSFQYCLPLALEILDVAKRTEKERTDAEEQITLALEFLSFQATLCAVNSYHQLMFR